MVSQSSYECLPSSAWRVKGFYSGIIRYINQQKLGSLYITLTSYDNLYYYVYLSIKIRCYANLKFDIL
jgi:hypothetical protein